MGAFGIWWLLAAVLSLCAMNQIGAAEPSLRPALVRTEDGGASGAQGPVIAAVARTVAAPTQESAAACTYVLGKSGHPLRWVRPTVAESDRRKTEAAGSISEHTMTFAFPSQESGGKGNFRASDAGNVRPLRPLDERLQASNRGKDAIEGQADLPKASGLRPANFSPESDVFANPFGDEPSPLSSIPDRGEAIHGSLRPLGEPRAVVTGSATGEEVPSVGDRVADALQEGKEESAPRIFAGFGTQDLDPRRADSQAQGNGFLYVREEAPRKETPEQDSPVLEVPKPLADQLAAGPAVSPDICPEPAGPGRALPQGLSPIGSLTHQIPSGQGRLPILCPMSQEEQPAPSSRGWTPVTFTWKASALCHKPAYFEQVHVERYGHTVGPLFQPIVSAAHFFLTVPILPYKMGLYPPNECIYALGHYRPGNCAPYMLDPLPLSLRAALFEAGAWTAAVFVIP
jgi:hypothetical protein